MSNSSTFHPDYFLLLGIPGLEESHLLLSIPFCVMYVMDLIGNSILILVIGTNETLQQPMYLFLMMLASCDLLLSSSTVPKTLCIFWFDSHTISFNGCLVQLYFIHFNFMLESAILMSKAFNTCVFHICVIVLYYIPVFFPFITHRVGHKYISAQFHILLANLYVLFPSMMNPIVYGMRTREIRRRVVSMLWKPVH